MARIGTSRAVELLQEVSRDLDISVKAMQSSARYEFLVEARREFCVRGVKEGLLVRTLAAALNRDVKTIAYHAFPAYRERKIAMMRKRMVECRAS